MYHIFHIPQAVVQLSHYPSGSEISPKKMGENDWHLTTVQYHVNNIYDPWDRLYIQGQCWKD